MDKDLTELGSLLEAAREALRPKLSQNALAKAAGTSPTTYRRIIKGVARFGGQDVPFEGSPDSIARIAQVLRVTPEQLEAVGREDVAEELHALPAEGLRTPEPQPGVTDEDVLASGLSPETKAELLGMREVVARWIDAGDEGNVRRAARVVRALDDEQDVG